MGTRGGCGGYGAYGDHLRNQDCFDPEGSVLATRANRLLQFVLCPSSAEFIRLL